MITFKYPEDANSFATLHPALLLVFMDLYIYTIDKHYTELVVTQTVSTLKMDKILNRVSPAHREHRAIDIRTKGLDPEVIKDIVQYINNKEQYKKYHYVSTTGSTRLAYHHVGTGDHIHLAIHSRYHS